MTEAKKAAFHAIVAMDSKRGIGKDGKLPWHFPEDLKLFKALTEGNVVIMGSKTYKSIGFNLPKRYTIVLTRQPDFQLFENTPTDIAIVMHSIEDVIAHCNAIRATDEARNFYVAGGGELYEQFMPHLTSITATVVDGDYECDTFMPAIPDHMAHAPRNHTLDAEGKLSLHYYYTVPESACPVVKAWYSSVSIGSSTTPDTVIRVKPGTSDEVLGLTAIVPGNVLALSRGEKMHVTYEIAKPGSGIIRESVVCPTNLDKYPQGLIDDICSKSEGVYAAIGKRVHVLRGGVLQ